jgi:hypothetical protein
LTEKGTHLFFCRGSIHQALILVSETKTVGLINQTPTSEKINSFNIKEVGLINQTPTKYNIAFLRTDFLYLDRIHFLQLIIYSVYVDLQIIFL